MTKLVKRQNKFKIRKGEDGVAAIFSLPEVNIYPNNRFGDIARTQGLETARNWRKVREGTTAGINSFADSPYFKAVEFLLPIPSGIEGKIGTRFIETLPRISSKTDNLITALGNSYQGRKPGELIGLVERKLEKFLKEKGVDVSRFGNEDLKNLLKLRKENLFNKTPNKRFSIITPVGKQNLIQLYNKNKEEIGNLSIGNGKEDDYIHALNIDNLLPDKERKVSIDLYNSAITYSRQNAKSTGVVSGEILSSPEQTYSNWKYFKRKKLLKNTGHHSFNSGKYVKKNGNEEVITNGPVYLLEKETKNTPTKSILFDPDIVDAEGKFHSDWKSKDIYKLFPLLLFTDNVYSKPSIE